MKILIEENNALSQKNTLLLGNNVTNLAKLQLKLEQAEREKSLIEKERDDNDETLVALNQKLEVLEKLGKEEANKNRKELEEAQKQKSSLEEDLKMARRKIKEQEIEMSSKHQSEAKTLLKEELIQEMNKEYERRLKEASKEAAKKLTEEKEKVKDTVRKLYEAKFEAEKEKHNKKILEQEEGSQKKYKDLKKKLDEVKKQLDEKQGLKAKLDSIDSLHKEQLKEMESNHKKVVDRYKTEMEKNEKFVDQGQQEMKILTEKYNVLQRKVKCSQRILSS